MKQAAPDKTFLVAPTGGTSGTCSMCAHCPWMAMNGLENLAQVLETGANQVEIEEEIRSRALVPIQRMLEFSRNHQILQTASA
jgi:quinolinate synthase